MKKLAFILTLAFVWVKCFATIYPATDYIGTNILNLNAGVVTNNQGGITFESSAQNIYTPSGNSFFFDSSLSGGYASHPGVFFHGGTSPVDWTNSMVANNIGFSFYRLGGNPAQLTFGYANADFSSDGSGNVTAASFIGPLNGSSTNGISTAQAATLASAVTNATTITPAQFGAKGDGVTDDAPAIQAAMNFSITSTNTWTTLDLQGKNYLVNEGMSNTVAHFTMQNGGLQTMSKTIPNLLFFMGDHTILQNLVIQGVETNNTGSSIGILEVGSEALNAQQEPTIDHVVVNNFSTNIVMYHPVHPRIINCQLSDFGQVGFYGQLDGGMIEDDTIEEGYGTTNGLYHMTDAARTNSVGVYIFAGDGTTIQHCDINACGRSIIGVSCAYFAMKQNNSENTFKGSGGDMYFTNCNVIDSYNFISSTFNQGVQNSRAYYDNCPVAKIEMSGGDATNEVRGTIFFQWISKAQSPLSVLSHVNEGDAGVASLYYGQTPLQASYFQTPSGANLVINASLVPGVSTASIEPIQNGLNFEITNGGSFIMAKDNEDANIPNLVLRTPSAGATYGFEMLEQSSGKNFIIEYDPTYNNNTFLQTYDGSVTHKFVTFDNATGNAVFNGTVKGGFVSTNGIGISATIPIWTNTIATHGYYLQVTNGIIVGYPTF